MKYAPGDIVTLKSLRVLRACPTCDTIFYTQRPNYCPGDGTKLTQALYYPRGEIVHVRYTANKREEETLYTIKGTNGIQYSVHEEDIRES